MSEKPSYRVPSMDEIAAVPPNGFRAISLFAGAGGSSLGYRMSGFRMLWASEFVEAAREVYEANAAHGTIVDGRDIREVDPLAVLAQLKIAPGDLDLLDGSPPCASFSTAGKRSKHWGQEKAYSDRRQRTDDLFEHYVRFVDAMRPKVFVAENVSGLVKGVAKGHFLRILAALKAAGGGYRVEAQLLDAQWLGVPQQRQRIIFVGVREDLDLAPAFPKPLPYFYSVRDAIGTCKVVEPEADISRFAIGKEWDRLNQGQASEKYFSLVKADAAMPSPAITAAGGGAGGFVENNASVAAVTHPTEKRKFSIAELRRICGFPDSFKLSGTYAQQWERLGRAVPPPMSFAIGREVAGVLRQALARSDERPRRAPDRSRSGSVRKGADDAQPRSRSGPVLRTSAAGSGAGRRVPDSAP